MASVHFDPRGKSPFLYAHFTDGAGKRFMRSTKSKDRREAQRIAETWEDAARSAGKGDLVESQARKVVSDLLERTGLRRIDGDTVEGYFGAFLSTKEPTLSPASFSLYEQVVREFLAHVPALRERPLSAVSTSHIEGFIARQVAVGKSNSTANKFLKILRVPFSRAHRQGLTLTDPTASVEPRRSDGETRHAFTREQIAALIAAADDEWRGLIITSYYCGGLRLGNASRLTWKNVDAERGSLRFHPVKKDGKVSTDKTAEVPLHPRLRRYLFEEADPGDDPSAPLFPTLARTEIKGKHGLSRQFIALMRKAGIALEEGREKAGKGRRFNRLSFHSIRHSAISHLASAGVASELRQKLSGHSDAEVHKGYTHHEMQALSDAVNALPDF